MPPNVNVNFEIDTRGGHCQRIVTSLVVLLCPTESVMSERTVRRGLRPTFTLTVRVSGALVL